MSPTIIPIEELDKLRDGWALPIGRFLVAFSSCEYWTYLYIQTFGSTRMREAVSDLNLKPRAELAQAILLDLGLKEPIQTRVATAFKELSRLASQRNLVAHNSPMIHVYADSETGELKIKHELRSARDETKDIKIADIEKLHIDATALDEELGLLYGLVRRPENRNN